MKTAKKPFSVRVPGLGTVRYQTDEPVPAAHAKLAPKGAVSVSKTTKADEADPQ